METINETDALKKTIHLLKIKQANEIVINNNPIQLISDLESNIINQSIEILKLSNELKSINTKYLTHVK